MQKDYTICKRFLSIIKKKKEKEKTDSYLHMVHMAQIDKHVFQNTILFKNHKYIHEHMYSSLTKKVIFYGVIW